MLLIDSKKNQKTHKDKVRIGAKRVDTLRMKTVKDEAVRALFEA